MNTTSDMSTVVSALTSSVGASQLWTTFGDAVPYIAVAVLFALGYRIIKKALKGTAKGKVSM